MSVNQTTVCDSCGAEHHSEVPSQPMLGAMLVDGRRPIGWSRVSLSGSRRIDPKKIEKSPEEEALDEMIKAVSKTDELPKGAKKFLKTLKQIMQSVMGASRVDHEHFDDAWDLCPECTDKLRDFLKTMDLKQELLTPRTLAAMAGMSPGPGIGRPPGPGRSLDDLLGGEGEAGDVGSGG